MLHMQNPPCYNISGVIRRGLSDLTAGENEEVLGCLNLRTVPVSENHYQKCHKDEKKKRNQLPIALLVFLFMVVDWYPAVDLSNRQPLACSGCLVGVLGLSCKNHASASRRRFVIHASQAVPRLPKAVLIAFALTTIGFHRHQIQRVRIRTSYIPGMSYVQPISLATVVGGHYVRYRDGNRGRLCFRYTDACWRRFYDAGTGAWRSSSSVPCGAPTIWAGGT